MVNEAKKKKKTYTLSNWFQCQRLKWQRQHGCITTSGQHRPKLWLCLSAADATLSSCRSIRALPPHSVKFYPSSAKVWSWIFWVETGLCDDVCATVSDLGLVAQLRCHASISFFFFFQPVIVRSCLGSDLRLARHLSCFSFPLLPVLFGASSSTVKKCHGPNIMQLSIPALDSTTSTPKRKGRSQKHKNTASTADFALHLCYMF